MDKSCFSGDQNSWGTSAWQNSASSTDDLYLAAGLSGDTTGTMLENTKLSFACKFVDSYTVGATLGTASQTEQTLTAASTVTDFTFSMAFYNQADYTPVQGTVPSGTGVYALIIPDQLGGIFEYGSDGWYYIPTSCEFGVVDGALDVTQAISWRKSILLFDRGSEYYWPEDSGTLRDYIEFFVNFDNTAKGWNILFNSFVLAGYTSDTYSLVCELDLCLGSNPTDCENWIYAIDQEMYYEVRSGTLGPSWDLSHVFPGFITSN